MNLTDITQRISELPLATEIATGASWAWLFPTIETLHVVAIATVFGSILYVDLRLLGFVERNVSMSKCAAELLPLTWSGFALAGVTGLLMFIARAPDYASNLQFRLKMLLILLAGLNMAVFQFLAYRRVHEWDAQLPPPTAARIAGLVSLSCWTGVIFLGRWIGFTM